MALRIGDIAPDFASETTAGRIESFLEWKREAWAILFSHPADFTPVCTTELLEVSKLQPEWDRRNVKVLGLSTDSIEHHNLWSADIGQLGGGLAVVPIIADESTAISQLYNMLDQKSENKFTVRSVYVIDPLNEIRLILTYPAQIGRNFDEILRAVDALQLQSKFPIVCPANWKPGGDVIVSPKITDAEATERLPLGFVSLKPYLRVTPCPDKA
jgi:alkyl hydroperoxide reductase subunit AhpC